MSLRPHAPTSASHQLARRCRTLLRVAVAWLSPRNRARALDPPASRLQALARSLWPVICHHLCSLLNAPELLRLAHTCRTFRTALLTKEAWQHQVLRSLPAESRCAPSRDPRLPSPRPLLPLLQHVHLHGNDYMSPAEYRLVSNISRLTSLTLRSHIHPGGVMIGWVQPQADQRTVDEWSRLRKGDNAAEAVDDQWWYSLHSPLLLCLHSLRHSLRYLDLQGILLDGLVMEECSAMPNLQVLRTGRQGRVWTDSTYLGLARTFPSLTSLTLAASCRAAVRLVGSLAQLEEVHWPELSRDDGSIEQLTSSCTHHLRALVFTGGHWDELPPPAFFVAAILRLPLLMRLTLDARYLSESYCEALFSSGDVHFPFLRCLELRPARVLQRHVAPQSDAALRFFVHTPPPRPEGRARRQAERLKWRRSGQRFEVGPNWGLAQPEALAAEEPWWDALYAAARQPSFRFPALECLDLPYSLYAVKRRGPDFEGSSRVSARMVAELRRSYEWERVEEWEVETTTLGAAEWRKTRVVQTW